MRVSDLRFGCIFCFGVFCSGHLSFLFCVVDFGLLLKYRGWFGRGKSKFFSINTFKINNRFVVGYFILLPSGMCDLVFKVSFLLILYSQNNAP
jgi:hypothetical protein